MPLMRPDPTFYPSPGMAMQAPPPDFSGLGPVADGRRSGVYRSVTDGSAGSLLPVSEGRLCCI